MKEISLLKAALYQKHFLELLFLFRPHQQYQTEKEESKAAGAEILVTFTSSKRYHSETGNRENASVSYRLRMVILNYTVLTAPRGWYCNSKHHLCTSSAAWSNPMYCPLCWKSNPTWLGIRSSERSRFGQSWTSSDAGTFRAAWL